MRRRGNHERRDAARARHTDNHASVCVVDKSRVRSSTLVLLTFTRQVTIYCRPTANQIGYPINLRRREPQVWVTQSTSVNQPAGAIMTGIRSVLPDRFAVRDRLVAPETGPAGIAGQITERGGGK